MSTAEVIHYQDPKSILIVNDKGQMKQLFTPFRVKCIDPVHNIPVNSFVFVDSVFIHRKYILLYWINQQLIPYHHFTFQISW